MKTLKNAAQKIFSISNSDAYNLFEPRTERKVLLLTSCYEQEEWIDKMTQWSHKFVQQMNRPEKFYIEPKDKTLILDIIKKECGSGVKLKSLTGILQFQVLDITSDVRVTGWIC